jgi:hypothetical protein
MQEEEEADHTIAAAKNLLKRLCPALLLEALESHSTLVSVEAQKIIKAR